jgi:anthranilate phosphoribosyltransferase
MSASQMTQAMESILTGAWNDRQIETFLLSANQKDLTAVEITAAAEVMRRHCVKLSKRYPDLVDTCGTGGDAKNSLNISTLSAIVASAGGVQIAKHGNRSVSSVCGSADLLEALGVKIDLPVTVIERAIETVGFGFFFAPNFHPAVRFAMPARKKIKEKTLFNILGPLSNPAGAVRQLIGVYDAKRVGVVAEALLKLGAKKALVVHGADGLDEITLSDETFVAELENGKIRNYKISPEDFGLKRALLDRLRCASKEECKEKALAVLEGEAGACLDVVCLNTGAVFYVAEKTASIKEGVKLAREVIEEGRALEKLEEIAEFSHDSG